MFQLTCLPSRLRLGLLLLLLMVGLVVWRVAFYVPSPGILPH